MQRVFMFALLISSIVLPTASRAADCGQILKNGIWNYSATSSNQALVSAFLSWYRSDSESNSGANKSALFSGSGYIAGLLKAAANGSYNENHTTHFLTRIDSLRAGYHRYDKATAEFIRSASVPIVHAWSKCMNTADGKLHASLSYSADPRQIVVSLQYTPIGPQSKVIIRKIEPPANIHCGRTRDITVNAAGYHLSCERRYGQSGGLMLVEADTQVEPSGGLPVTAAVVHRNRTGQRYGTCQRFDVRRSGVNYGPPEVLPRQERDIGGGGKQSAELCIAAPAGYVLANLKRVCQRITGDNPCAFVHFGNWDWRVPNSQACISFSTDSTRASVYLEANKRKVIPQFSSTKVGSSFVARFGDTFDEFVPVGVAEVDLTCATVRGNRVFRLNDLSKEVAQLYVVSASKSPASTIYTIGVAPTLTSH